MKKPYEYKLEYGYRNKENNMTLKIDEFTEEKKLKDEIIKLKKQHAERIDKITKLHKKELMFYVNKLKKADNKALSFANRIEVLEKLLKLNTEAKEIDRNQPMIWIKISELTHAEEIYRLQDLLDRKTEGTHILITRDNIKSIEAMSDEQLEMAGLMRIKNEE